MSSNPDYERIGEILSKEMEACVAELEPLYKRLVKEYGKIMALYTKYYPRDIEALRNQEQNTQPDAPGLLQRASQGKQVRMDFYERAADHIESFLLIYHDIENIKMKYKQDLLTRLNVQSYEQIVQEVNSLLQALAQARNGLTGDTAFFQKYDQLIQGLQRVNQFFQKELQMPGGTTPQNFSTFHITDFLLLCRQGFLSHIADENTLKYNFARIDRQRLKGQISRVCKDISQRGDKQLSWFYYGSQVDPQWFKKGFKDSFQRYIEGDQKLKEELVGDSGKQIQGAMQSVISILSDSQFMQQFNTNEHLKNYIDRFQKFGAVGLLVMVVVGALILGQFTSPLYGILLLSGIVTADVGLSIGGITLVSRKLNKNAKSMYKLLAPFAEKAV